MTKKHSSFKNIRNEIANAIPVRYYREVVGDGDNVSEQIHFGACDGARMLKQRASGVRGVSVRRDRLVISGSKRSIVQRVQSCKPALINDHALPKARTQMVAWGIFSTELIRYTPVFGWEFFYWLFAKKKLY